MVSPLEEMSLEATNMAGVGGAEDRKIRKEAAKGELAWAAAGQQPGVQVWRIENMQVVDWPTEKSGQFHMGDSYIILETLLLQRKYEWNVFFWIGNETSVDEQCVAAYKTVELCSFLDGQPKQRREAQEEESRAFRAVFPSIRYLPGGVPSGLRHVITEMYEPKLFHIRKTKAGVIETEVECERESLNEGDCFILDVGKLIYIFHGKFAHPLEKYACNVAADRMECKRRGQTECTEELDNKFWNHLGGRGPVKKAEEGTDNVAPVDRGEGVLYKLSDASGRLQMFEVARKKLSADMLDTDDVMMLDREFELFLWIGARASKQESRSAMNTAQTFTKTNSRDQSTPIHLFKEGQRITNKVWNKIFVERAHEGGQKAET